MGRSEIFIGREREQELLRAAVDDAGKGEGRLILLSGEAGIGKTRTAQEIADYAVQRGNQVLWGRCYEEEGAPAFYPWMQVLRAAITSVPRRSLQQALESGAADIAQLVPELRTVLPDIAPAPSGLDSAQTRFRVFQSVTRFLINRATQSPMVIVIDDLHGADPSSLRLVDFVARELGSVPLTLLVCYRDDTRPASHPLTTMVLETMRLPHTRHISLSGLTPAEVAQLLEAVSGVHASGSLSTELHARTEGNPLFVGEYVRLLLARLGPVAIANPNAAAALQIPRTVKALVERRLTPLSQPCRDVLMAASAIGREFLVAIVEAAICAHSVATTHEQILRGIGEAREAHLVVQTPEPGRLRFAHAVIRETLYEQLQPTQRARLHRDVAHALERSSVVEAHLAELTHHLLAAADHRSLAKVPTYAERAGTAAMQLLAFEEALRLYQLGLTALDQRSLGAGEPPPDPVEMDLSRAELLLHIGEALNVIGETAESKSAVLGAVKIARRLGRRDILSRAALGYGVQFAFGEGAITDPVRIGLLEEAIASWGAEDSAQHVRLLGQLAMALFFSNEAPRRALLSATAVAMAQRLGDESALAFALHAQHVATWRPDNTGQRITIATDLINCARRCADRHLMFQGHFWRANDMLEHGNFDGFAADLDSCARLADELQQPQYRFQVECFEITRATLAGNFEEARGWASSAYVTGVKWHAVAAQDFTALHLVHIAVLTGDQLDAFVIPMQAAVDQYAGFPGMRSYLAALYAELDQEHEARQQLERLAARDFADLPRDSTFLSVMGMVSSTCTFLRDRARANIVYELLTPHAARAAVVQNFGPYYQCIEHHLGMLAHTLHRWEESIGHFENAMMFNRRMRARPQVAQTQYAYADARIARDQAGDRSTASQLLVAAYHTARELRMCRLESRIVALAVEHRLDINADQRSIGTSRVPGVQSFAVPSELPRAEFRRDGDYWTIAYGGTVARLKDSRGLQYLHCLLGHPGQEFLALDLVVRIRTPTTPVETAPLVSNQALPAMDAASRAAYKSRIAELRHVLAEAVERNDIGAAERAQAEMQFIEDELVAAVGLGGRERRMDTNAERARSTVTKGIKSAIAKISASSPALGRHLDRAVRTGVLCVYRPDPDDAPRWQL